MAVTLPAKGEIMKYSDINRNRAQNSFLNIYNCKTGLVSIFPKSSKLPTGAKTGISCSLIHSGKYTAIG